MFNILYTIFLLLLLGVAAASIVIRKKVHGIKGVKPFLSSGCFFVIALLNLLSGWFHFYGLATWSISLILLFLAAYSTKYLPDAQANQE